MPPARRADTDDLRAFAAASAQDAGLDPEFVARIIQAESNWDPHAVSKRGAVGLMQLLPATARQYGVTNLLDPRENIKAGIGYLKDLHQQYGGRPDLVAAAYNAGPEAVNRAGGVPHFRETQAYVKKVAAPLMARATPIASEAPTRMPEPQRRTSRTLSESEFNAIKQKVLAAAPDHLSAEEFQRYAGPALAGAIGEAENLPAPATDSAIVRFAQQAWHAFTPGQMLTHPLTTAEHFVSAVQHPLGTLRAMGMENVEQARKAREAYRASYPGHTVEALGHAAAAAFPFVGPPVAAAGERVGEQLAQGDVAGAAGAAVGQVAGASPILPSVRGAVIQRVTAAPGRVSQAVTAVREGLAEPVKHALARKFGVDPEQLELAATRLRLAAARSRTRQAKIRELLETPGGQLVHHVVKEAAKTGAPTAPTSGGEERPATVIAAPARTTSTPASSLNVAAQTLQTAASASKVKLTAEEFQAGLQMIHQGHDPADVLDGLQAVRALRASPSFSKLPSAQEVESVVQEKNTRTTPAYGGTKVVGSALGGNPFR